MAALTVNSVLPTGLTDTLPATPAGGGDTVANPSDQTTWVEVANASGSSINVTIAKKSGLSTIMVPGVGPLAVADIVVAVANGARKKIGPFSDAYTQADGTVSVTCSATSSVTIGAFRLPKASPN